MGHDAKLETWLATTGTLLVSVDSKDCQPFSIPIVPEELRKWNEKAYEPKVVSIGPRFNGRRELLPMEETKWRCMMSLLNRTQDPLTSLKSLMEIALALDAAVRASYGEKIIQDRYELATIMVNDGCFLLELLSSGSEGFDPRQPSFRAIVRDLPPGPSAEAVLRNLPPTLGAEVGKMKAVLSDLTLLENQIPLFILIKFFTKLFPHYENEKRL
ncbi:UPF0481 protein [Spatholobus suberectus]|nr:UPF0481 protein [Spatholobus suberectus]